MEIANLVSMFNIWGLAKIFALVGLAIYTVFTAVVIRQVKLMKETIDLGLDSLVMTAAWAHFFLVMAVFLGAVIFL